MGYETHWWKGERRRRKRVTRMIQRPQGRRGRQTRLEHRHRSRLRPKAVTRALSPKFVREMISGIDKSGRGRYSTDSARIPWDDEEHP